MKCMKRMLLLLVILAVSAVTANAITITSGAWIGQGGAGTGEGLASNRFRSFQPHQGQQENYLGIPSLGNAANRVGRDIGWMTDPLNPLTSFDFTFQYDQATDKLITTIYGGTLEYLDWSTKLSGLGKTKGAADLNAFQISVGSRDANSSVYLTGMVLDGTALGSFNYPTVNSGYFDWLVTGSDMNLTNGFTLTGTLWLQGPFLSGVESSVVNLTAGWDSRGVPPGAPIPEPGTLLLLGSGFLGLGIIGWNRKRRA